MEYSVKILVPQAYLSKDHLISSLEIFKRLVLPQMPTFTCIHACTHAHLVAVFLEYLLCVLENMKIFYYKFSAILQLVLQEIFTAP